MTSLNLCDVYRTSIPISECICQCPTTRRGSCKNFHKYRYELSNGEEYLTCSVLKHREFIMKKCKNNITTNISKIIHRVDKELMSVIDYTVIALDVNEFNDYECPLVSNCVPPNTMKNILKQAIRHNNESENNIRKTITVLKKMIRDEERKLTRHARIDNEYHNALYHMRYHVKYMPNAKRIKHNDDDICTICHESFDAKKSSALHECGHIYHNDCIRTWFKNKEMITCPCCRTSCDPDKYFVYDRYVPIL